MAARRGTPRRQDVSGPQPRRHKSTRNNSRPKETCVGGGRGQAQGFLKLPGDGRCGWVEGPALHPAQPRSLLPHQGGPMLREEGEKPAHIGGALGRASIPQIRGS